jgi:hypothetical protein
VPIEAALAALGCAFAVLSWAGDAVAAPGDVLFFDDFESGFGQWTTTDTNLSGINSMASASHSLFTRGDRVTTTSIVIDATVPAIRIDAWIRRGADAFSEDTDSGEDLTIEYLDDGGSWQTLVTYQDGGVNGEVISFSSTPPSDALHAGFRLRVRQLRGSGGPPENGGIGWDYWHLDDFTVTETEPALSFALGRCEEFDAGLGNWTVIPGFGTAATTAQTSNTPPSSLAIFGGTAQVLSEVMDLSGVSDLELSLWIQRGDDDFSEDPDPGEDLYVEYLDDTGAWITLESFRGNGRRGEIFTPLYTLHSAAAHAGFRIRL